MFTISKSFDFCYAHRVYTQNLDKDLSCNAENRCRHLHGHQGSVTVKLSRDTLDERGFVLDYNELSFFKKMIDTYFDHKTIFGVDDPILRLIDYNEIEILTDFNLSVLHPVEHCDLAEKELVESITILPFIPTSENLAKYFKDILSKQLTPYGVSVSSVSFSETSKTTAEAF